MPRRRAMRIMLAGVAGATLPGWRPARAFARRAQCLAPSTPCGNRCCPGDTFCADAASESCCATGTTFCPPVATNPFSGTCCDPGATCNSATGTCCDAGLTPCGKACCGRGTVCGDPTKNLCCPEGAVACGTTCCPPGASCANADIELCCKARSKPCEGKNTITCCLRTSACCEGKCCTRGKRCVDGKCEKCPSGTTVCGDTHCCKRGEACCGGRCCPSGQKCAFMGPTKGEVCCPTDRILKTSKGNACCPPGMTARRDACCPKDSCQHCDGELPCLPGTYCINGSCRALK
jgi:hypothetical protein